MDRTPFDGANGLARHPFPIGLKAVEGLSLPTIGISPNMIRRRPRDLPNRHGTSMKRRDIPLLSCVKTKPVGFGR